jgi:hypothetical protein
MEDHHWPRIVYQLLANRQALLLKLSLHGLPKANLKGCVAAVRLRYIHPVPATPSTIKLLPRDTNLLAVQVAAFRTRTLSLMCQMVNGLITNDKFCMSRSARLSLSWRRSSELGEPARRV